MLSRFDDTTARLQPKQHRVADGVLLFDVVATTLTRVYPVCGEDLDTRMQALLAAIEDEEVGHSSEGRATASD